MDILNEIMELNKKDYNKAYELLENNKDKLTLNEQNKLLEKITHEKIKDMHIPPVSEVINKLIEEGDYDEL